MIKLNNIPLFCIYKLTSPSDKIYIGKTKDFKNRMLSYKNSNLNINRPLINAIKKYGFNNFKCEIITYAEEYLINDLEIRFIKMYKRMFPGMIYNASAGGDGGNTGRTEKMCGKTFEEIYGIDKASEIRKKMRINHKGMSGRKHTAISREKMSKSQEGSTFPIWAVQRSANNRRGKSLSLEHKKKVSESLKGKPTFWSRKPIACYGPITGVLIKEYDYVMNAEKETKIKQISRVLTGKRKTAGGYIWRYLDKGV